MNEHYYDGRMHIKITKGKQIVYKNDSEFSMDFHQPLFIPKTFGLSILLKLKNDTATSTNQVVLEFSRDKVERLIEFLQAYIKNYDTVILPMHPELK